MGPQAEALVDASRRLGTRRAWSASRAPARPYAMVLCKDGRTGTAALRASLERFNEPPEDGWRWTVDALTAHLLSDLCGITLAGWRYPPNRRVCPHGNAYANDGSSVRWLASDCARCVAGEQPGLFRIGDDDVRLPVPPKS